MKKLCTLLISSILMMSVFSVHAANSGANKAASATPAVTAADESVQWAEYSPDIFESAKKTKHTVILFTMADACVWCHKMAETTFKDPAVIKFINENFYPVILHADIDNETADKYNIVGLPTIIFFDADGKDSKRTEGYIQTPDMMKTMKDFLAGNGGK